MFKPHYAECKGCYKERLIVVKDGYCNVCNDKNKNAANANKGEVVKVLRHQIQRAPIKKKFKRSTGEMDVFTEIWIEREHYCQCCGEYLGEFAQPFNFSHVLSKGAYPAFRTKKENIWLEDRKCHDEWEFGDRNQPKFAKKKIEYQRLKELYYAESRNNPNNYRRGKNLPS